MPLCQVLCIHRGRSPSGGVVDGFTSWRKAARIGAQASAEQAQDKEVVACCCFFGRNYLQALEQINKHLEREPRLPGPSRVDQSLQPSFFS